MNEERGSVTTTGPLLFIRDNNRAYYGEKTKEEFIMGIKKFIKTLITLDKLNQELNEEIRRLKAQVKEEAKNPKYWKPEL